jgi:hypothetical protein
MNRGWLHTLLHLGSVLIGQLMVQALPVVVDLAATVPLTVEDPGEVMVEARLYAYDPWLADVAANLVDLQRIESLKLSHRSDSLIQLTLEAQGIEGMAYYCSIRITGTVDGELIFFNDQFLPVKPSAAPENLAVHLATHLTGKGSLHPVELIYPPISPKVLSLDRTKLGFELLIQSVINHVHLIEASDDLQRWTLIGVLQADTAKTSFRDTRKALFGVQFYRVRLGQR